MGPKMRQPCDQQNEKCNKHNHKHRGGFLRTQSEDGTRLSLVGAIQAGKRIDERFGETMSMAVNRGTMSRTGNQTITERTERNLKRTQKTAAKSKEKAKNDDPTVATLKIAETLIREGVSVATVDKFLKTATEN
jgi:hypothetical protein